MLPYNKRPKSDSSSNAAQQGSPNRAAAKDEDLGEETLLAKDSLKSDAVARARARAGANLQSGARANAKDKASGSLDRPRLFQDSLSEDDVTRLMPSTRDVSAAASPSKPTASEFARVRPAAGKRDVELSPRPTLDDELATNVFDQPAQPRKGGLAQGRRPVLAGPSKATLLEPVPGFMDTFDERATITNERNDDDDRTVQNPDTGERAAYEAARESAERAKRAPAAFARVEPISPVTAPHPFAPRPATPLAAQSGPVAAVPLAALSDPRLDAGTSVTGSRAAVSEGRSMGAWAVAFAAVVLLVAGGAFAALKNPGGGSEVAVSIVDPMSKGAAAQPLPPAPQVVQVAPLPQPVVAPQPVAQPQPEPPAALPAAAVPIAPSAPTVEPPVASSAVARGSHHASPAAPPRAPAATPVAVAPRAPSPPPAAAAPKAPKEPKKGGMSDEEKKLSDEAKALADKQLQQSL